MKKLTALLLCIFVVAFIFHFGIPQESNASSEVLKKTKSVTLKNPKVDIQQSIAVFTDAEDEKRCSDLSTVINDINFEDSRDKILEAVSKDQLESCRHKSFRAKVASIIDACFGPERLSSCERELMLLRALMRAPFHEEPYSQTAVADLLMIEYSKDTKERDQRKLADLTKQLLEKDPRNRKFQKLWAVVTFDSQVKLHKFPKKSLKKEIYERLDPELWQDGHLEIFRWHVESGYKQPQFEAYARRSIEYRPDSAFSHEVLGWSLWQQNKREEAISHLKTASVLFPKGREYYSQILEKLNSPEAKLEDYPGRISDLGVEWEDLYN